MSRLIVDATSGQEWAIQQGTTVSNMQLAVSVSRADDGSPVTGLAQDNFRVSYVGGENQDMALMGIFKELKWEPADVEGSALYLFGVTAQWAPQAWTGQRFVLCVQARTLQNGQVVDQGQGLAIIVPVPPGD